MGGRNEDARALVKTRGAGKEKEDVVFFFFGTAVWMDSPPGVGVRSGVASRGAERRGMGGLGGGIFFFPCGAMRTVHSGVLPREISSQVQATRIKCTLRNHGATGVRRATRKIITRRIGNQVVGDEKKVKLGVGRLGKSQVAG